MPSKEYSGAKGVAECIAKVNADFDEVVGKVLAVRGVHGFRESDSEFFPVEDGAASFRVYVDSTPADDLEVRCDAWIDPCWNVVFVDADTLPGVTSPWLDGHSYNVETGEVQFAKYEVVPGFWRCADNFPRCAARASGRPGVCLHCGAAMTFLTE